MVQTRRSKHSAVSTDQAAPKKKNKVEAVKSPSLKSKSVDDLDLDYESDLDENVSLKSSNSAFSSQRSV